jgi:branched-subunit amino acid aminotransferase/4-amino-4-deoxychorismate lyase
MLDLEGFVSETNSTNLFMVDGGILHTPSPDHCLPGITRETVLMLAQELGIMSVQRRISLAEFHTADEVFTTGTMGGITPVTNIDGRIIGNGRRGIVTEKLQQAYSQLSADRSEFSTPIPRFCTS